MLSDVVVVGAGPAGSVSAMLLARAGLRVTLLERARLPRPKPCGEFLSPGVLDLLDRLGLLPRISVLGGRALAGFTVQAYGRAAMTGHFGRAGGWGTAPRYGLGLERSRFDLALAQAAVSAGAELVEAARAIDLLNVEGTVTGVRARHGDRVIDHHARLVVGADGLRGITARRLGLRQDFAAVRRVALVAHLDGIAGLSDHGEMHVAGGSYCGVAPQGAQRANVAMVLDQAEAPGMGGRVEEYFRRALARFGDLGERSSAAEPTTALQTVGPLRFRARRLVANGAALVGDAGGYFDPFTGQGVYKAIRSATLLARVAEPALAMGPITAAALAPYERRIRAESRPGFCVEWLIQHFLNKPHLLCRALSAMHVRPALADTLVGVTGDVLPARRVLSPLFLGRLAL